MKILPNIGIDSIRFGMTPDEVVANFQEKQTYENWMGGNLNDALLYHGIILGFDECNSRGPLPNSHWIEARIYGREDAELWERNLKLWTIDVVKDYLKQENLYYQIEINGDLTVKSLNLSLSFNEENQLDYIELWKSS